MRSCNVTADLTFPPGVFALCRRLPFSQMHPQGCFHVICLLLQPPSLTPVLTPGLQTQPHFIFSPDYTLTGSAGAPGAPHNPRGPSAGPCFQILLVPPEENLSAFTGSRPQFPRFYRKQPEGGKSGSSFDLSTTSAICWSNHSAGDGVAPRHAFPSGTWSLP